MDTKNFSLEQLPAWQNFIKEYQLNDIQTQQFAQYFAMLCEYNELFNLTAITDPADIIAYHFQDSLAIGKFVDFNELSMIADVGSGAGFPGIPLKILYPHLDIILIEVTKKKIEFLETVISTLKLDDSMVMDIDWRTFLRKTNEPIDLFVSRASLHTGELARMFKQNCPYKTKIVVYWASKDWQMGEDETPFFVSEHSYTVKDRERRLIFFAAAKNPAHSI